MLVRRKVGLWLYAIGEDIRRPASEDEVEIGGWPSLEIVPIESKTWFSSEA